MDGGKVSEEEQGGKWTWVRPGEQVTPCPRYLIFHTEKKRKIGHEVTTLAERGSLIAQRVEIQKWSARTRGKKETREGEISRVICF